MGGVFIFSFHFLNSFSISQILYSFSILTLFSVCHQFPSLVFDFFFPFIFQLKNRCCQTHTTLHISLSPTVKPPSPPNPYPPPTAILTTYIHHHQQPKSTTYPNSPPTQSQKSQPTATPTARIHHHLQPKSRPTTYLHHHQHQPQIPTSTTTPIGSHSHANGFKTHTTIQIHHPQPRPQSVFTTNPKSTTQINQEIDLVEERNRTILHQNGVALHQSSTKNSSEERGRESV